MLRHLGCIIRACDLPGILLGTSDLAQGFAHYARPLKLAFLDALDALCFGLHCLLVKGSHVGDWSWNRNLPLQFEC